MENVENNLKKANAMLSKKILDPNLFMRIYSFATENIAGYIKYFDLENKSLLTLGSSGDQVMNAYNAGCRDITLIDVNPFASYYTYLKIAAIESLTYQEFEEFFFRWIGLSFNYKRFNIKLFQKLSSNLKTMDYDSFYFFSSIFHSYSREQISDYLMNDDETNSRVIKGINTYLQDETSYNRIKKRLKDFSLNFLNQDILEISKEEKFNIIFLSNLCTYMGILQLKDLLMKLKENNLTEQGSILFGYLWNINFNSNEEGFEWKEIYRMPATRIFLKEFISDYFNIKGTDDIRFKEDKKSDLIMIYKR